jgi:hypothetical protein
MTLLYKAMITEDGCHGASMFFNMSVLKCLTLVFFSGPISLNVRPFSPHQELDDPCQHRSNGRSAVHSGGNPDNNSLRVLRGRKLLNKVSVSGSSRFPPGNPRLSCPCVQAPSSHLSARGKPRTCGFGTLKRIR